MNARHHLNSSLTVLMLTSLALPFTSSADTSKTQDIKLGMDVVCGIKFTPEGDVYAAGYNSSNRKNLFYTVLQQNFTSTYEGTIESPDGGEASCSSDNIIPGKDGDLFIPVAYDSGSTLINYVYRVKFKEKQTSVVFKKDDIHFDKIFLGTDMTTLYVSFYPRLVINRNNNSIAEVELSKGSTTWEKDFLFASRGSIVSPDNSMIYLINEQKAEVVSLTERSTIGETPHLVDGFELTADSHGDIYGMKKGYSGIDMVKIRPFSSISDKLLWEMQYPGYLLDSFPSKKIIPGSDETVYITAISRNEGPGIQVFDMKEKVLKSFIPLSHKNARIISPVIFDKNNTKGYTYTAAVKESENGTERSLIIWSFSPETKKTEVLTTFTTDHPPRGFNLINNRLVFIIKDTIHIIPLDTVSEEYRDTGLAISGTLPEEQDTPLHSHRHITWQVNSPDGESLDSGSLTLPAADPDMLGITAWTLRLGEGINRRSGGLKAGIMKNGVITPVASSYLNHFWLPEGEKWQGATVRLTFLPSEATDDKWRLNNRDDSALPVSLVTSEQSVLPEKMVFQLSGKKSGAGSTLEIDGLSTKNRFTWAMDVARKVNAKSDVVKLGELSADGGQSVSPLGSQYRNRLWVASDGDVEVTGCTPAVFCQTGN